MAGPSSGADAARTRWELENNIQAVSEVDGYFKYNQAEQQAIQAQKPWARDPHYFKHVRISALALLKMAMHAKSGGNLEIMGMLQGKIVNDIFIILDAYALPVEGTETRVNAQSEAYEYVVDFGETSKSVGRLENAVGWYHSHPGYGCWLSGIDCSTQMTQQQYNEPFLAIVVDPHRTIAAGKVEIGAFRTYPEGYKPTNAQASEYQTIPMSKIEDFGVHANQYYPLDVSFFKSTLDSHMLDMLWNKYWVNTLAASPLINTRELTSGQISDIAEKLEAADVELAHSGRMGRFSAPFDKRGKDDQKLGKLTRDTGRLAVEQIKGISSQVMKDVLFNLRPAAALPEDGTGAVVQHQTAPPADATKAAAPMEA